MKYPFDGLCAPPDFLMRTSYRGIRGAEYHWYSYQRYRVRRIAVSTGAGTRGAGRIKASK